MKYIFWVGLLTISITGFSQQDTSLPAYQRYPTIPGLQLLTLDSTRFTKENIPSNQEVLLMLFSPDCDHCQHEAEQIVANKKAFANTYVLLVSTYPLYKLKAFRDQYGLGQLQNAAITKDPYYILLSFYNLHSFPYLALYNKKKELIRTFEGSIGVDKIRQWFTQNQ